MSMNIGSVVVDHVYKWIKWIVAIVPRCCKDELTARRGIALLLIVAAFFPAMVAFGIIYWQELPLPYQDDYAAILAFAANYNQSPTVKAKILAIAADQFNEYKFCFAHSLVVLEMRLTGHLNFVFLTAFGNLFLLPIYYLLWQTYRDDESDFNRRLFAFLPISFLFFSLTYWEILNWATTDLSNIPVIFFSFLAIHLLIPRKVIAPARARFILACLAAALAACSSANGFLVGAVGLLILFARRAYAKSLVWCASFAVPIAAYLYHYTVPMHPMHPLFYLTRPLFFLVFLGCGAIPFRWPAVLAGIVVLIILRLAVRSRFDRTNPVAFYFAVWIMATTCLVSWVRGAAGLEVTSRYSIYSILLLIFCYSYLARSVANGKTPLNRRRFHVACLAIAVSICLGADIQAYGKLAARRRMVLTGIELYRAEPEVNSPMIDPIVESIYPKEKLYERVTLTNAIQKHVYALPPKQAIR
jgi:hypothetical protein